MGERIPVGIYCYDDKGLCEYWELRPDKPPQMNGYCRFLKEGDWESRRFGLLWDQCKECGVNE